MRECGRVSITGDETTTRAFRYADLFAGVGGFAAVLEALGGDQAYSVEIDAPAARVYQRNWGHDPLGDVTRDATDKVMRIPAHDVLAGGFPCQPFSKSGAQRGMDETRGTLFFNIMSAIKANKPTIVMLENVRNLVGPRHRHEWELIIGLLRDEGYQVASEPAIFSPHQIAPSHGGSPQVRDRVFITATRVPDGMVVDPDPEPVSLPEAVRKHGEWHLLQDLPLDEEVDVPGTALTLDEIAWITHWEEMVQALRQLREWQSTETKTPRRRLPGFPIWADSWKVSDPFQRDVLEATAPDWKADFYVKNWALYDALAAWARNEKPRGWLKRWQHRLDDFPESRRKLEWQAQDAESLWECVISLRPSGLRVKRETHLPALVAITQTPIIGRLQRRLSAREAARLQGLPDNFDFGPQRQALTYKQMGNGVNAGVVWNVLKAHCERDAHILQGTETGRAILQAVTESPGDPSAMLAEAVERGQKRAARALESATV